MLGAVHSQTLGVALLLTTLMFGLLATESPITLDFVGVIFLGLIGFTVFQLLPLPSGLVSVLSPASHKLQFNAMAAVGEPLSPWISLTVDGPTTIEELAKLLFYLSVYWTIKNWARQKDTQFVLQAITAVGAACAIIFIAHKIAMLDKVYGFYEPVHLRFGNNVSAPFINTNHMSAFLSLTSFVSIGLALTTRERSQRLLLIAVSAVIGGALLLTLSRGGIAAYVAGQLIFITIMVLRRIIQHKSHPRDPLTLSWVPLGLALSLGLGMMAAQDAIIGEYVSGTNQKIEIFEESLPLLKQFPFFGAGRGNFLMVFPTVSSWASRVTFTHAENIIVQLFVDYGIVVGSFTLLAFILVVSRRIIILPARSTTAAVTAGLIATGIHNLVDFNLEIPGVAIIAVAMLAILTTSKRRTFIQQSNWRGSFPKGGQIALTAASLTICGALFFYLPKHNIDSENATAEAALHRQKSTYFEKSNLVNTLKRHPASYYISFLAGLYHYKRSELSPLPLLAHAVERNPHAGGPHYYIGKLLLEHGYLDQSMMEFRLAARNDARYARFGAKALIDHTPDFSVLQHWAVTRTDKRTLFEALAAEYQGRGLHGYAEQTDKRLLRLKRPPAGALIRHAKRVASTDPKAAIKLATQLEWMHGYRTQGILLKSEIFFISKNFKEALHTLETAPKQVQRDAFYLRQLASTYQKMNRHDDAIKTAHQLRSVAESPKSRAAAVEFEGDLETMQHDIHSAKARYKQAVAMLPDNVRIQKKLLRTAQQTHDLSTEINTLRRLHQLEPQQKEWRDALKAHADKIIPPEI